MTKHQARFTVSEALTAVRGYARANRITIVGHALGRMEQRGARYLDVQHALQNASTCVVANGDRFRITGPDLDADELTAIVSIEDGVLVVTIY